MSFLVWKKKRTFVINDKEPVYKVRYLGNVQTSMMKGDGCVDKPVGMLWNNYLRSSSPGIEMHLAITASGLKANTKEQGLTAYRAHRISYCIAHPNYPRLFIWVYRHEGKKMKLELRCHAVLCKTEVKAKAMAVQLHDKIGAALSEFLREKKRRQNSRLTLQRTNSFPRISSFVPKRQQMLSSGQNFKPPVCQSNSAPKLGSISEGSEEEEELTPEELEELDGVLDLTTSETNTVEALTLVGHNSTPSEDTNYLVDGIINLEMGNDIDELKRDVAVQFCLMQSDSDDESAESGFHEQDSKDNAGITEECEYDYEDGRKLPEIDEEVGFVTTNTKPFTG